MPQNSTIFNLPEDTSVTIADYVAIVTPGAAQTKKAKLANILALATGSGAPNFIGKFPSLAALQSYLPTGADGNYAVVTASPNDEEYIWDGDNHTWVKTQNVPASTFALVGGNATDNPSLASELSARDTALAAEISNRASADTSIQSQISALSAALIPSPTYTHPAAGISSTQSNSGLEIGQTINIPLTATYIQNDGGAQTGLSIQKNGTQISITSPYTDPGVPVSAAPVSYKCTFNYGQGAPKANILGIFDAVGLSGGTAISNTLSFQGFYRVFYDAVSSFPSDSATARALSNSRFSNSGNSFTLNTGSIFTKFCVILPPGKTLASVIDQDALNLDITSQYSSAGITVNDAAGTPVTGYTIWSMSQSVPYSTNHRHNITIA